MSMTGGYDALDELYERLRDAEETQHAQRAGGITPETIRAARGGVTDGHGRELHVVDENAAGGDSAPLAGISRDSRERIEADAWEAARLDMSRTWEERRDAIVALLDRQAAITEREVEHDLMKAGRMAVEVERKRIAELEAELDECKLREKVAEDYDFRKASEMWEAAYEGKCKELASLQAVLDAHGNTHVELPLDADGAPIRVGDVVDSGLDSGKVLRSELWADGWVVVFDVGRGNTSRYESAALRHVKPRTLEDVLRDCCTEWNEHLGSDWETGVYAKYAAEIRGLLEVDV